MAISCCYGCVAPKRNPYCHSSCPEYIAEKEAHDKRKAEYDREQSITEAILLDRKKQGVQSLEGIKDKKVLRRIIMFKRCSNCDHCAIDMKAMMYGVYIHKCFENPIFIERHHILHPFWSGWRCKKWRKRDGK